MGAPDILAQLHAVGVNLSRRGDKLVATPKAAVTPEIVDLLRAHKPELLAALEAVPARPPLSKASEAELVRLVTAFAASEGFTEKDTEEALRVALADPDRALSCYRALVAEIPTDPRTEARRTRVLDLLEANPTAKYAVVTDLEAVPGVVVLTIAIRGQASFDLHVPKEKWDGVLFLELLERHSGTVH